MQNLIEITEPLQLARTLLIQQPSIYQQQRQCLINAIDAYSHWRNNKTVDDGRGYAVSWFTWLRHYTAFGEQRAQALKQALMAPTQDAPLYLLQNHFRQNSKLDNHSLDTYLLEGLYANKPLFLIPDTFITNLRTLEARLQLRNYLTGRAVGTESDVTYQLAQYYEETNTPNVWVYYAMAAIRYNHAAARDALERFALAGNPDAQYVLGVDYYHQRGQVKAAINWCLQAAEQQHVQAQTYLLETTFPVEQYVMLAKCYDEGKRVKRNLAFAIIFYDKAAALNHQEAACRLGELYLSPDATLLAVENPLHKAFEYYVIAAKQHNEGALQVLETLARRLDEPLLHHQVANLYLHPFAYPERALRGLKHLAEQAFQPACKQLQQLTTSNPDYAYLMATFYDPVNQAAYDYYVMAIQANHSAALAAIERLAQSRQSEAQYILGIHHYHRQGEIDKAIPWCLRAGEQQHVKAQTYLLKTVFSAEQYVFIAKQYDRGEMVSLNTELAIIFYQKAADLYHLEAAYRLGQLYEASKLFEKAFDYYAIAAKQKNLVALADLERLAHEMNDAQRWLALGVIYEETFNNVVSAVLAIKKSCDLGHQDAKVRLQACVKKDPNYAYQAGRLYEASDRQIAYKCYTLAIRANHSAAFARVIELAQSGCIDAQFTLAHVYHDVQNNKEEATYWAMQAQEHGHPKAFAYLSEMVLSAEQYFLIAKRYDEGDGITRNINCAVIFYEKAYALHHPGAAYRLGQLDEANKLFKKAFDYYAIAAKQKNLVALADLERLAHEMNDAQRWLALGVIYEETFNNVVSALSAIKKSCDLGHQDAKARFQACVKRDSNYAYQAGRLYEASDRQIAYKCYTLAIRANHSAAFARVIELAQSGCIDAQFTLAHVYHDVQNNKKEATYWAMQAQEHGHPKAFAYLNEMVLSAEQYFLIAKRYDEGDGVTKNIDYAVIFYEKACALHHPQAAYRLGQLDEANKLFKKAFDYYAIAAKQQDKLAFQAMVALIEQEQDHALTQQFAEHCLNIFNERLLAFTYLKKLAEKQVESAASRLLQLAKKTPSDAYMIGQLYEEDLLSPEACQQACVYYAIAIENNTDSTCQQQAQERLNTLLQSKRMTVNDLTALGLKHDAGTGGLTKNYQRAKQCFELASAQGGEIASYHLGLIHQGGGGIPRDNIKAARYLQLAADKLHPLALIQLEKLLQAKTTTIADLMLLAQYYQTGRESFPKQRSRAIHIYQVASQRGEPAAQLHLGRLHEVDSSTEPEQSTLAFQAYLAAAKQGRREALDPLERLGEDASAAHQLALSKLYATLFHHPAKASYWQAKALEVDDTNSSIKTVR